MKNISTKIVELLSVDQKERLDSLLVVNLDTKKSKLAWLQNISGKPSKDAILSICNRISVIKEMKLKQLTFSFTNEKRLNQIARLTERYSAFDLRRF